MWRAKPWLKSHWQSHAAAFAVRKCKYCVGQPAPEAFVIAELFE